MGLFEVTPDQAQAFIDSLTVLKSCQGWDLYEAAIKNAIRLEIESLIGAKSIDEVYAGRARIVALRHCISLPDSLISMYTSGTPEEVKKFENNGVLHDDLRFDEDMKQYF